MSLNVIQARFYRFTPARSYTVSSSQNIYKIAIFVDYYICVLLNVFKEINMHCIEYRPYIILCLVFVVREEAEHQKPTT